MVLSYFCSCLRFRSHWWRLRETLEWKSIEDEKLLSEAWKWLQQVLSMQLLRISWISLPGKFDLWCESSCLWPSKRGDVLKIMQLFYLKIFLSRNLLMENKIIWSFFFILRDLKTCWSTRLISSCICLIFLTPFIFSVTSIYY